MSNILIVEDTITQALLIQHMLKNAGFTCTIARSGAKALEVLDQGESFDAILSDVNMPEMDGLELCTAVKAAGKCSAPFVLLISLLDITDVVNAAHCGADNILWKEYDDTYFVPQLQSIIATAKARTADGNNAKVLVSGEPKALPNVPNHKLADMLMSAYTMALHQKSGAKREPAKQQA